MARGDKVKDLEEVTTGNYLTIQPGAGEEWSIHNLYSDGSAQILIKEGSNEIKIDECVGAQSWLTYFFDLTNTHYLRMKNVSGSYNIHCGYDGVQTK